MDSSPQKRKIINLGIKTRLQLKYLKLIVGSIIINMLIVGLTFYVTFKITLSTAQLGRYAEGRLNEVFAWLNFLLILEAVIFAVAGAFFSLKLSHRIVGPLTRMEKMIHEIAEKGGPAEIKIRKDDELQDLASEVNNLVTKLTKK